MAFFSSDLNRRLVVLRTNLLLDGRFSISQGRKRFRDGNLDCWRESRRKSFLISDLPADKLKFDV